LDTYDLKKYFFQVKASKEVILCTGAIGSPQLLMLSGIGDNEHLSQFGIPMVHHLPGVGQNLQDHVASYGLTWITEGAGNAYNPFLYTVDPRTYINWKLARTGMRKNYFLFLKNKYLKQFFLPDSVSDSFFNTIANLQIVGPCLFVCLLLRVPQGRVPDFHRIPRSCQVWARIRLGVL
jgi:hypothetical protein